MIARFGEPPRQDQTYKLRPGAYAVLLQTGLRGDRMLITYQAAPDDEFQLPGGGIDPGESPVSALHREVLEETGWTMGRARRVGAYRRFTFMPEYDMWAEKLCSIYVARPAHRVGPPTENGHTAHWVSVDAALGLLANSGDRFFAEQFLR
ncbi:NUDIX hydrolase [Shimia abyssi]|uniref:8-oxo-dGTP diphosphatase n=1 Tax=Shimia abyssi TaxID=1662395 RepID=A0A2P8F8D5_9RHOB|nr:NUDIX hydrolase [Shimia abyssi]PSL17981.1 8-oxo-dGTP diphosphatase [Shimia abyssi]